MLSQSSEVPRVDNCVLSKEQRIRKQKSSKKAVFSRQIYSENSTKRLLTLLRGHMGTQERLKDNNRHTLEAISQLMRVVVIYRKGQKQLNENCSTSEEYIGQTTYLRPSVTWNALNCFSRRFSEHQEAQVTFLVCATGQFFFGNVDKVLGNLCFDNFQL